MITFNKWFCDLLSPERQMVLRDDKWGLAEEAFNAGLKLATLYKCETEIHALISTFTFDELNNNSSISLLKMLVIRSGGIYNPRIIQDILKDRMGLDVLEPYGGNLYLNHVEYLLDGTPWKCKHGLTMLDDGESIGCIDCYNDFIKE